ncbi:MAG: type II toxin-antitoxin system VapC family toxin [Acinetobacter sp.]|nr:type II toxin-antitoxin system VapC family toxin [Acinetobacter sp.]
MKLLLDTHAFIWFIHDSPKLSNLAKSLIVNPNNECFISLASIWEMSIKSSMGKLDIPLPIHDLYEQHIVGNDMELLPITIHHIEKVHELPFYHKDPFDRMIIAQSIVENMTIISCDSAYHDYPIHHAW